MQVPGASRGGTFVICSRVSETYRDIIRYSSTSGNFGVLQKNRSNGEGD